MEDISDKINEPVQENAPLNSPEEILNEDVIEPTENQKIPDSDILPGNEIISLKNIDVFQKNILILPKVNMSIKKGEFVYLIGRTGSGKSSILKVLIAEIPALGEEAMIAGFDLKKLRTGQIPFLRRKLGVVFQDYQLLSDKTVLDNLLFVLNATHWKNKNDMLNRAEEVLQLVGLATKDFKYPHQLSGGEQQRVCIARALLNYPEVILADEPTGNLDPITSEEIFHILHSINKNGTTILMATHNFSMIDKFSSRTICIEDGKLIDSQL